MIIAAGFELIVVKQRHVFGELNEKGTSLVNPSSQC